MFLLALVVVANAQFDWVNDVHVHRAMQAAGFYAGDVNAAWSEQSDKAFKLYAARDGVAFGENRYRPQDDVYAKQRVGAWIIEHDVSAIKPRRVGVFFIQFNKARCAGSPDAADCKTPSRTVETILDKLFRSPEDNLQYYFGMGTRGMHQFTFSSESVHHISLGAEAVKSMSISFLVRDETRQSGWDAAERFDRRIYILPPDYNAWTPGTAGMASGQDVFVKTAQISNLMHEMGHTLGLGHNGKMRGGSFDEYDGASSIMSGSFGGYAMNAPELDWLRVISHNVFALETSMRNVKINSITSISKGYRDGDRFSPVSGWVAAVYKSPNNGPEYFVEWRERIRQDKQLNPGMENALLIHHVRPMRQTELDVVIPLGQSWTSPRGDLIVTHTGPAPGTFDVFIGPATRPDARVSSWTFADWLASFPRVSK